MTKIPDDLTPIIYWIQPDGSCHMEWPDGEVIVFTKAQWDAWCEAIKRGEIAHTSAWIK